MIVITGEVKSNLIRSIASRSNWIAGITVIDSLFTVYMHILTHDPSWLWFTVHGALAAIASAFVWVRHSDLRPYESSYLTPIAFFTVDLVVFFVRRHTDPAWFLAANATGIAAVLITWLAYGILTHGRLLMRLA